MREESEESNPDPAAVAKWEETWKSRWAMPFASTTLLVLVVICLTTAFHWSTERTLTCILLPLLLLGGLLSYLTALEPAVESLDQLHCGASLVFWIIAAVVAFFSFGFLIYSIEHEFEDLQKALKTASNPAPVEPPRKPKRDPVQDAPVAE